MPFTKYCHCLMMENLGLNFDSVDNTVHTDVNGPNRTICSVFSQRRDFTLERQPWTVELGPALELASF